MNALLTIANLDVQKDVSVTLSILSLSARLASPLDTELADIKLKALTFDMYLHNMVFFL